MFHLGNLPGAGSVVIVVILAMFILAVFLLLGVYGRYSRLAKRVRTGGPYQDDMLLCSAVNEYTAAYALYGEDVDTPAVVENIIASGLGKSLLAERYLNNAVSLFVTMGLFGTFLGLSLSVSSLTELISYSNTSEWLSVLDSVGGGLMSALSGMGVAFYTSLVGVACAITLTILRTIFSPQAKRAMLQNNLELWLDSIIAPTLTTSKVKKDADVVAMMVNSMNQAASAMERTLNDTTASLKKSLEEVEIVMAGFDTTVEKFNKGVRDFGEVDYNLRGTVERMDVASRDLVDAMRRTARALEGSGQK